MDNLVLATYNGRGLYMYIKSYYNGIFEKNHNDLKSMKIITWSENLKLFRTTNFLTR